MKKKIVCIFIVIFLLISFILNISIDWLYETFENLSMEEIIFHLKVPMEGTNYSLVWVYIKKCLFKILCHTGLLSVLFIYPIIKNIKLTNEKIIRTSEKKLTMIISSIIVLVIFGYSVRKVLINSDIVEYISNQMDSSTLIATEYVDPKKVDVKFGYYQEIVKEDLNDNISETTKKFFNVVFYCSSNNIILPIAFVLFIFVPLNMSFQFYMIALYSSFFPNFMKIIRNKMEKK